MTSFTTASPLRIKTEPVDNDIFNGKPTKYGSIANQNLLYVRVVYCGAYVLYGIVCRFSRYGRLCQTVGAWISCFSNATVLHLASGSNNYKR